jgi:hypothetical protein
MTADEEAERPPEELSDADAEPPPKEPSDEDAMSQSDYLQMVQGVISRMASNSFVVKGWSVTLTAALLAFAAKDNDASFAWIAAGAVAVFGVLDARYLALERAFISVYDTAAQAAPTTPTLTPPASGFSGVVSALFSWSVALVHGVALAAAIAVAVFG